MNPGVVSLRCPACARPFLSLPQQRESLVACPHCGQAAIAGSFAAAGTPPGEALVRSLRQRVLQPETARPRPQVPQSASWPSAPTLFAGPARQPPLSAEEPQWPFIPPEDSPVSPFAGLNLDTPEESRQGEDDLDAADLTFHPERNLTLGLSLLTLVLVGIWVLWLTLQPPLAADIPAAARPESRLEMNVELPLELEPRFETVRRADLTPQP